jgi:hypothetical protein
VKELIISGLIVFIKLNISTGLESIGVPEIRMHLLALVNIGIRTYDLLESLLFK